MAGKTVNFNADYDSYAEDITKWLSCNGEAWGVGPTVVFAAAAALFLHHEVQASLLAPGDHPHVSLLENTLIVSMVVGMLALMVHVWVCLMRFFQYYLDTLIRDSPNVLLEMTTAGLLGAGQAELAALGPLTRFLRQQQPQIHITVCWLLALCYADYVRKHCCRFNVPYLEQWQAELHAQARRRVRSAVTSASGCVATVHARLRGFAPPSPPGSSETHTVAGARGADRPPPPSARGGQAEVRLYEDPVTAAAAAVEAFEKLRAYIKATRCVCTAPGACSAATAVFEPGAAGLVESGTGGTPRGPDTPREPAAAGAGATQAGSPVDGAFLASAARVGSLHFITQQLPAERKRSKTL